MNDLKIHVQPKKNMIFWGYLSNIIVLFTGVGILPILTRTLPSDELAFYFVLQSVTMFVSFVDIGYGPQLSKYITYILSGAQSITPTGLDSIQNRGEINSKLLSSVVKATEVFYKWISIVSIIILIIFGYVYIYFSTAGKAYIEIESLQIILSIYLLNIFLNIATAKLLPFLNGAGLIIECRKALVLSKVTGFAVIITMVYFDYKLSAFIMGNLCTSIVSALYASYYLKSNGFVFSSIKEKTNANDVKYAFKCIISSAKRIAVHYISSLANIRGAFLIGSAFVTGDLVAEYGLLIQLVTVINTFSSLYSTLVQTSLAHYNLIGDKEKAVKTFAQAIFSYLIISSFGVIALSIFGNYLLDLWGSKTLLPDMNIIIFCGVYLILDKHYQIFIDFLISKNDLSFVPSSFFSSIISMLLLYFLLQSQQEYLYLIFLVPCFVQLSYNYWYWPYTALKKIDINYFRFAITSW